MYGVPQSSALGPLLFLIYINGLNQAIKFCKVHHLADDINLVHFSKSITKLKYVNLDMKNLTDWLNAHNISVNVQKTELVNFKHQRKKIDSEVKIKFSRKRLYFTDSVKYLGIRIDENLHWKHLVSDIAIKLNRANALLFKIRNFVNVKALKTIYYTIFDSHINYANVIWAQNSNAVNRVSVLQKKALRIISFHPRDCYSSPLFKKQNLLKFEDKIQLENVLLVSKYFNNILPSIFDNWFTLCSDMHNYNAAASLTGKLFKPSFCTILYDKNSITLSALNAWNKIQTAFGDVILKNLATTQLKNLLTKKSIDKY